MQEKVIDLRGKECPYTLLDVEKAREKLKKGERLVVIVDYPPAVEDTIPALCEKRGFAWRKEEMERGVWRIIIQG